MTALIVAVVACVVALGASVFAWIISRRLRGLEAVTGVRVDQEANRRKQSLEEIRGEQATRLADVASRLEERLDGMDRLLADLRKRGEATRAQAASAVEALARQVAEARERTRDELVQARADVAAHKESTISEVSDLLRRQTDSLRNDLVARLAETDALPIEPSTGGESR